MNDAPPTVLNEIYFLPGVRACVSCGMVRRHRIWANRKKTFIDLGESGLTKTSVEYCCYRCAACRRVFVAPDVYHIGDPRNNYTWAVKDWCLWMLERHGYCAVANYAKKLYGIRIENSVLRQWWKRSKLESLGFDVTKKSHRREILKLGRETAETFYDMYELGQHQTRDVDIRGLEMLMRVK